jgi:hypothetical protein
MTGLLYLDEQSRILAKNTGDEKRSPGNLATVPQQVKAKASTTVSPF